MQGKLTTSAVLARLMAAIENRQGFALIRLGDGEGRLLGYPRRTDWTELAHSSLSIWFGADYSVSQQDVAVIAAELRTAIQAADIVGLPRQWQIDTMPEWRRVIEVCADQDLVSPRAAVVDTAIHQYLHFARAYQALLMNRGHVGLVTCRDIAKKIAALFSIGQVDQYLVPAEAEFPGSYQGRHFPDRFDELRSHIRVPEPGTVFLVGAGALGKIYCHWIKQRGGVAIDIGSVFDAWCEVHSRARFSRFPDQFRLDVYDEIWTMAEAEIEVRVAQARALFGIL